MLASLSRCPRRKTLQTLGATKMSWRRSSDNPFDSRSASLLMTSPSSPSSSSPPLSSAVDSSVVSFSDAESLKLSKLLRTSRQGDSAITWDQFGVRHFIKSSNNKLLGYCGLHGTEVTYLLLTLQPWVLISSIPIKISEEKLSMLLRLINITG